MTDKQEVIMTKPNALIERLNQIFIEPETNMADDEFFDQLMMRSEPLPWLVPAYENSAGIPISQEEVDQSLIFRPNPRDLIAANIALSAEVTLRFVRVLDSHNRVHRIFALPYGVPSDFERRSRQGDPMITAMKEAFILLHGEIAAAKDHLERQIDGLKKEQKAAQDRQSAELRQLRQRIAVAEAQQQRRLTRASWRVDPLFVGLSLPIEQIPFQFTRHYSELFWHLVAWGNYQSTQTQQAWFGRGKILAYNLLRHVNNGGLSRVLTAGEIGQFTAWVFASITNPGAWMMGFNPDQPDALMIRGR